MSEADERYRIKAMEVNVVYGCNLKCQYCTHYSREIKGMESVDTLREWFDLWKNRVHPRLLRILGGEPLLHPNLPDIIRLAKESWPDSDIEVITNGLLLRKASDEVFKAMAETGIRFSISMHYGDRRYFEIVEAGLVRVIQHSVRFISYNSHRHWGKPYRLSLDGKPLPFASDPDEAWEKCPHHHKCATLYDGKIYHCPQVALGYYGFRHGYLGPEWAITAEYQPLSPGTREETEQFFHQTCGKVGSICPLGAELANQLEKAAIY